MKFLIRLVIVLIIAIIVSLNLSEKIALANTINGQAISKNNQVNLYKSNNKQEKLDKQTDISLKNQEIDNEIKDSEALEIEYAKKGDLTDETRVTLNIVTLGVDNQKNTIVIQYGLILLQNLNKLYLQTGKKSYIKLIEETDYMLATVFNIEGELSDGEQYFNVAQNINYKYKIKVSEIDFIKSNYYYYQSNYKMAEQCATEGIKTGKNKKQDYISKSTQMMYLIKAEIKLGELSEAKKNLNYTKKFLNDNNMLAIQYYYYYGETYQDEKEWKKSINCYLKAYKYLKNQNLYLVKMSALDGLAVDYSEIGDYKNSCKYYKLYVVNATKFDKSKEKVNTTMLVSLDKNNPQNILNEIYMRNTRINNEILLILVLATIIVSLIFAYKYFKKLKNEKRLKKELDLDLLTRAYNRRYALNLINKYSKNKKQYTLAMVDVDDYKNVNDTYGHIFGDEVLVKITRTMIRVGGEKVSVIRYGGEEFLLIIENNDIEISYKIVENIRMAIESLEWIHGNTITISIGLIQSSEGNDILDVLDKADELLYKAKATGKNKTEYNKRKKEE